MERVKIAGTQITDATSNLYFNKLLNLSLDKIQRTS
jgi:hypothetical protein